MPANKARILVVDDTDDILILTKTALELEGHVVTTARGGKEGLRILGENRNFDLLLIDVRMEGISGLDFLIKLEEMIPSAADDFRIVFLTAGDFPQNTIAHGFIKKAQELDEFLSLVNKYLS